MNCGGDLEMHGKCAKGTRCLKFCGNFNATTFNNNKQIYLKE